MASLNRFKGGSSKPSRGAAKPQKGLAVLKDALEREAMDINSEISRTLGGDRAFLFAASFGYGSNIELKVDECNEVLKRYEERVASFRKGKGA